MNIAEILKNYPKGTKLYSPLFGECKLIHVDYEFKNPYPIVVETEDENFTFTKDGLFYKEYVNGECMLFPSKDIRDWSTLKSTKKPEFNPFDKVLVRNGDSDVWQIEFFGWIDNLSDYKYQTTTAAWKQCIHYEGNEHLLGTSNNPK